MTQDRILTTHVGSLIRPAELTAFLLKQQNGEPIDTAAYEECLRTSVTDVVRKQAEIGIDIISDGEFGKNISWSRYVLERMSGFTERQGGGVGSIRATAGKDRRDFAEFYAEYEAAYGFVGMGRSFARTGLWAVTGPINYTGQAAITRDIEDFKTALAGLKVEGAFLPVVAPASVAPERGEEYYKNSDESLIAIARALREEYKAIIDAGLTLQIDDAFLATFYDVMVPPHTFAEYKAWASFRVDATNEAIKGLPHERIRYPRVLGQLEWTAHQRRRAQGHRRFDPADQCRCLFAGDGQSAARARVARMGKRQASRRQGFAARRRHPCDQYRRASRGGRGAHRAARQAGRA
jgi:Methionine synthase II (cobalamin-independent)